VPDILQDCVSGLKEKAELEKGRKKREKMVEATGAKFICRNSDGGDVLDN
jgi:hypothetical protein